MEGQNVAILAGEEGNPVPSGFIGNHPTNRVSLSPFSKMTTEGEGVAAAALSAAGSASMEVEAVEQKENATSSEVVAVAPSGGVASPTRKSSRDKVSTMIYVDGQYIKKSNNYVVRGGEYVYGGLVGQAPPVRRPAKKKPTGPKAPRVMTQAERVRRVKKSEIEHTIQSKVPARHAFLKEHADTLSPFLEPKVLNVIQNRRVDSVQPTPEQYMQPDSVTADMRDYQLEGLNWMSKMYSKNLGMILGDEMGLGKTLQTISLVCHLKDVHERTGPSLIICPLSVLYSWCAEISKWAPSLKFLRFHNSDVASIDVSNLSQYDMIVTTYEMAKAPQLKGTVWQRQQFNLLVLDEGHRIKCADTQIAQAVRKIHSECRIILTGTPLANNLVELWSLLNFLLPDVFTTSTPFAEAFDLTLNHVDPEKLQQAHGVLQLFMLRRLKSEVEKLMPKKIETKVICPLSNTQIWWYKAILMKDIGILASGATASKAKILNNLIMQLRKCCIHPFLFPDAEDIESTKLQELVGSSGKLAVLDKLLCSLYKKGNRVCLFSQFTSALDILDDYCNLRGWNYCRFDGGTARAKRNYVVNGFNAPNSQKFIFLMSTRSGGMGLNLQTADTVVLFDSDWNPQPDIQAMARVHRIGQKKTVHVYRLVTEGTVEQRMVERAEKKLYLDKMVTRDEGASMEEVEDHGKLMNTLKFGCQAVFGKDTKKNALPTDEDIALITDRMRKEDFSEGKLKGGADEQAVDFDATKEFTGTMEFSGIDFTKIRDEHKKTKGPKDMGSISAIWRKRQRKSRIMMVASNGSGYGAMVPVLAANNYELATGERSVFQQELSGRASEGPKKNKKRQVFKSQDFCQSCDDGGRLLCCPRCPVSLHLKCAGVRSKKEFAHCSHHRCVVCDKPGSSVGGFLYPCSACPSSFCEDHLPAEARFIENNDRMEALGYELKHGVYIHCSDDCEKFAIENLGYKVPGKHVKKEPCPPSLDLSSYFGGAVDDSLDAPDEVLVTGKRRRPKVSYASPKKTRSSEKKPRSSTKHREEDEEYLPEVIDVYDSSDDSRSAKPMVAKFASLPASGSQVRPSAGLAHNSAHHAAYRVFSEQERALVANSTLSHTPEEIDNMIENRWNMLTPAQVRVYEELATLPPGQRSSDEYMVWAPITPFGLLLAVKEIRGLTCFLDYKKDPHGNSGPAEDAQCFRGTDQVIGVDGQNCDGQSFDDVLNLLTDKAGKKCLILRMRQLHGRKRAAN